MKGTFTGQEMQTARRGWNLSAVAMATLLHVHVGTVQRWEAAEEVSLCGLPARLYALMLRKMPRPQVSSAIVNAAATQGSLAALGIFIDQLQHAENAI